MKEGICDNTYTAYHRQTCVAALNDKALHCPCPVPVYLDCCVGLNKDQIARCELLVAKVRSMMGQKEIVSI